MKTKKILFSIIGGLALPMATLSSMSGCSCTNKESEPTKESAKVVFDNDQILKRATLKDEKVSVRMIGLCSAEINPENLDQRIKASLIRCSEDDLAPFLEAKIVDTKERWITIEVNCDHVTKPCVIYYNMLFTDKVTKKSYEADTPFILYPVGEGTVETIYDTKVIKTRNSIDSIAGHTCSVLIDGFSVNGGNEGLNVVVKKDDESSRIELGKYSVVKGQGGNFSVRVEFNDIPLDGGNIKFHLEFKDETNPTWDGGKSEGFNFYFNKPAMEQKIYNPENPEFMNETSWTTIANNDGFKNDMNCLFCGFKKSDDVTIENVFVSATAKGKWSAQIVDATDHFDVYVFGEEISLTAKEISIDFTFAYKVADEPELMQETHSGFVITVKSNFSLSHDGGVYCFKVWNLSDPRTMKLSYSSPDKKSKFLGYALYGCNNVDPNKQIVVHIETQGEEFIHGPWWKTEIFDRNYFNQVTKEEDKSMMVELVDTNYISEVWTSISTGSDGIYSIYTD